MTDTTKGESIDVDTFRAQARAWVDANLERRPPGQLRVGALDYLSLEHIAAHRRLQAKVYEAGYAGITFPREYGGRGLSGAHERAFREEASGYVVPDLGGAGHVTMGPIARSLLEHGTDELCRRHIPRILSGEEVWCQFYSEPEAGSDLAGIRTSAVRDGERWVLNGSKIWSTGAYYADFAMCLARTDWDAPKHRGLTWFVVPTDAQGLTIRPVRQINGTGGFCEEFLDDVVIDGDAVIGEVNQGWSVTQTMLVYERGAGDSGASVEPRILAPDLVRLARKAQRNSDPETRQLIARAHINDWAQFHLGRRIGARLRAARTPDPAVAAYGKLASGMLSPLRARMGMQIGGFEALTWEDDTDGQAALDYLNARMPSIAGGTNEMQRNGIGERVLGLPREPTFDSNKPFSEVIRDSRHWSGKVS